MSIFRNHMYFKSKNEGFDDLQVKIFAGSQKEVEKNISFFLSSVTVEIVKAMQSENNMGMTATIFYYAKSPA